MSIHRVQTGNVNNVAVTNTKSNTSTSANAPTANTTSATPPKAVAIGVKGDAVNARLASYQERVNARIDYAIQNGDLSDRQKAALEKAKAKFESSIQRLDEAYSENVDGKRPVKDGLMAALDMLRTHVNHVRSGGNVDIKA